MQTKNEKHLLAKVAAVMLLSFATVAEPTPSRLPA